VLFDLLSRTVFYTPSLDDLYLLSPPLILNKLMDVFFAKLPQALSLGRTKFNCEQPRLPAA
jgi:hypothetical protein